MCTMRRVLYVLCLCVLFYVGSGQRRPRRLSLSTRNDGAPKIFNYNQFLRSPHSSAVDSKVKVETLGVILKGNLIGSWKKCVFISGIICFPRCLCLCEKEQTSIKTY